MGVSWKGLIFVLTAMAAVTCFVLLSGSAQKSAVEINYLGLTYEQSSRILMPDEKLLNTGVSVNGLQLYVPVKYGKTPPKAPEWVFAEDADGKYHQYRLSTTGTYAYALYGEYNANETVVFKLENVSDNNMPVEIQQNIHGTWTNVSSSALEMTSGGDYQEWTWDQKLDDGSIVEPGQYRALIGHGYVAPFNISPSAPALEASNVDYYNTTQIEHNNPIMDIYGTVPEYHVFGHVFNDSKKTKADTVRLLEYKAWMKGQDPAKLESAFNSAYEHSSNDSDSTFYHDLILIPSYALHANYDGRPAWYIVYNWEIDGVYDSEGDRYLKKAAVGPCSLMHVMLFVVDDETGKILHWESCA